MTDITELAPAMKAAATEATLEKWYVDNDFDVCSENYGFVAELHGDNLVHNAQFIAVANPANILALVEALENAQQHIARQEQIILNQDESLSIRRSELEEAQRSANISNQWKPNVCPITSRRFFMWIEHPEFGYVPTYGGPYDSYTIPTRDSDGEFSCERYDHDVGGWVDGECTGLYLVDDDELCDVEDLKPRIAELESRTVTVNLASRRLPTDYVDGEFGNDDLAAIHNACRLECKVSVEKYLSAHGIVVKWEQLS